MRSTLLLCLTLTTFRLFAQDNPLFRHLPPDATGIYQFNLPVILSKLSWQELAERIPMPQQNTFAPEIAAILREPDSAGVDIGKDLFLVESDEGRKHTQPTPERSRQTHEKLHYISLLLHLLDSAKFTAFLRSREPGIRIDRLPDSSFAAGSNGMGASWNHDLAIISFARPSTRSHIPLSPKQQTLPGSQPVSGNQSSLTNQSLPGSQPPSGTHNIPPNQSPPGSQPIPLFTTRALGKSRELLRGYGDTSLIRDPFFITGFSDDADIHAWTLPGSISVLLLKQLLHLDLSLPGSGTTRTLSSLRFENDRIHIKSLTPLPAGSDSSYAQLIARRPAVLSNGLSTNMTPASHIPEGLPPNTTLSSRIPEGLPASHIPEGPILAMLNLHFDPAAIGGWLDSWQARGRAEAWLFDKGWSLETFVHAFRGDFLLAAVQPVTHQRQPSLYLTAALGDVSSFWWWMGRLKWLDPAQDSTGGRGNKQNAIGRQIPAYIIRDSLLVIGPSKTKTAAWFDETFPKNGSSRINNFFQMDDPSPKGTGILPPASSPKPDSSRKNAGISPPPLPQSPLTIRVDLKAVAGFIQHLDPTPSQKNLSLLHVLSALDQFVLTAGQLNKDGQVVSDLQLIFNDPSGNSLRTLFTLLH
ncbi:MAG TPA: hypothetical protein VGM30_12800 [Puia sp.]|jgi:hypothetical protein